MKSLKSKKISSSIAKEISSILLEEARDELLKTITITGCEVSNDLSYAKIYFTSISNLDKKQLEKELDEASFFLRKELASRIELRHTPELKFIYDESVEYGSNIEKILKEIKK